ncbi:F0F1 ATP synthase subunit B [Candidatus Falkowbacteria bacterium]|nr:F0F1 ATP synthase subunit B [Candidatus Falkowbacteria bacterium]
MESLIQTFHIDFSLLFAQIVNFGIVFLVLYVFALKPLSKVMQERTKVIEKGVVDAKMAATTLAQTQEESKKLVTQAKFEAQEIVKAAHAVAEEKRVAMINQAKDQVAGIVDAAKQQINQEKMKMISEAKAEVTQLVIASTKAVLGKAVHQSIDEQVIKESVK